MADDSGIDPRYAAQFQRGYDGALYSDTQIRRGPVRLEGGPPTSAPRVPDPPRMTPDPTIAEEFDALVPTLAEADPPAPAALTWWDWLLPAIGAGLIVITLMLVWSFGTDPGMYYGDGTSDEWALFLDQARYMLPGPLLTGGIFAVTAGIVLQALRPRG